MARLYCDQGEYWQAEPHGKRALEIFEKALGPTHPVVAATLEILAEVYRALKRDDDAEILEERAAAIRCPEEQNS